MSSVRLFETRAPATVLLIRLLVGAVILSEGIQKFVYPAILGEGRFAKIGIVAPSFTAPFVGVCEIVAGALVLAGLATRPAAIVLFVDMVVAIASTKIPILSKQGFFAMAHEARTDWSMILGALFLAIEGAGKWSLDAHVARRR